MAIWQFPEDQPTGPMDVGGVYPGSLAKGLLREPGRVEEDLYYPKGVPHPYPGGAASFGFVGGSGSEPTCLLSSGLFASGSGLRCGSFPLDLARSSQKPMRATIPAPTRATQSTHDAPDDPWSFAGGTVVGARCVMIPTVTLVHSAVWFRFASSVIVIVPGRTPAMSVVDEVFEEVKRASELFKLQ